MDTILQMCRFSLRANIKAHLQVLGGARRRRWPHTSPFSDRFDPYRIKRVPVVKGNLAVYLKDFRDNPGIRFVSDGDPDTISYPVTLASVLGQPRNDLELRVVTYEP